MVPHADPNRQFLHDLEAVFQDGVHAMTSAMLALSQCWWGNKRFRELWVFDDPSGNMVTSTTRGVSFVGDVIDHGTMTTS